MSPFVFKYIPAFNPSFPQRSFVFNNIRASFVHFLKSPLCRAGKVPRTTTPCPSLARLSMSHIFCCTPRLHMGCTPSAPKGRANKAQANGLGQKGHPAGVRKP